MSERLSEIRGCRSLLEADERAYLESKERLDRAVAEAMAAKADSVEEIAEAAGVARQTLYTMVRRAA